MPVQFTQSCPTCGRRIQVRASLLGCTVACQHCKAEFVAEAGSDSGVVDPFPIETDDLMARVERALGQSDETVVS
ncbi:MAG: response regulator [Rubripirellula sp.]